MSPSIRIAALTAFVLGMTVSAGSAAGQYTVESPLSFSPAHLAFSKTKVGNDSEVREVVVNPERICLVGYDCNFWRRPQEIITGPFKSLQSSCSGAYYAPTCTIDLKYLATARGRQVGFLQLQSDPYVWGVTLSGKGCKRVKGKRRCYRKGARKRGRDQ